MTPLALALLSAFLVVAGMPPFFNLPFVGFVALVPLFIALHFFNSRVLIYIFGFASSVILYSWYVDVFDYFLGILLIIAVSLWHASLIRYSFHFYHKSSGFVKVFTIPIIYTSLEFLQRELPCVKEWWFVPYAKTQWGFPEALGLLSVAGISGATFILILSNSAIANIASNVIQKRKQNFASFIALIMVALTLVFGYTKMDLGKTKFLHVMAISDMANELSESQKEGYFVSDKNLSQKIFQTNIELSKKSLHVKPDVILWSENEFMDANDTIFRKKLAYFAKGIDAYIITDAYLKTKDEMYDTALITSPLGKVSVAKKSHLFSGELHAGFSPSDKKPQAILTDFGKVGVGVCYDFHFLDVSHELAKSGAKILFFPTDDDMKQNTLFPYFHATDTVFRAIEYGMPVVSANTNGVSMIVDANGKILQKSPINRQSSISDIVSLGTKSTFYLKYKEWFGYLLVSAFVLLLITTFKKEKDEDRF